MSEIAELRAALAELADGNPDMMDGAEIDRLHGPLDAALDELERLRALRDEARRAAHSMEGWIILRRALATLDDAEREGGAG